MRFKLFIQIFSLESFVIGNGNFEKSKQWLVFPDGISI